MVDKLNFAAIFQAVADKLNEFKEDLNQADDHNYDHGDDMVQIFQAITEAMDARGDAEPADQLAYASELLRQRSQSETAQAYADGLEKVSQKFQGQQLSANNALYFLLLLFGGGGDSGQQEGSIASFLASFIDDLDDLDVPEMLEGGDFLSAAMSLLDSKQLGTSDLEGLVETLVSSTEIGQLPHRAKSGSLVANTLFNLVMSMMD